MALSLPNLTNINLQQLLDAGMLSVQTVQKFITAVVALVQGVITLEQFLKTPVVQEVKQVLNNDNLLDHPATEEDLAAFRPVGNWLTDAEIQQRITDITQAVALSQWVSGFLMAIQLMMMFGGAA